MSIRIYRGVVVEHAGVIRKSVELLALAVAVGDLYFCMEMRYRDGFGGLIRLHDVELALDGSPSCCVQMVLMLLPASASI